MLDNIQIIRKFIIIFICFLFLLSCQSVIAEDWPMFKHDSQRQGYTQSLTPSTNNLLWSFLSDDEIYSSPSIVGDKVYFTTDDGVVYCLNVESGEEIWSTDVGHTLWTSSPTIYMDKLYIGGDNLVCLDASNGELIWEFGPSSRMSGSPLVYEDRVFIGSWDNKMYCFDATPDDNGDGVIDSSDSDEGIIDYYLQYDLIWTYQTGNIILSSPSIYENLLYFGSYDKNLYCLYSNNGTKLWNYQIIGLIQSTPVIYENKIFFGSDNYNFYCLYSNNGTKLWKYKTYGSIVDSPAVYENKVVFGTGFTYKHLICLDSINGNLLWSFSTGHGITSSPSIAENKVYFGSMDGKIYCVDLTDGSEIWQYETDDSIDYSSPAISDGKLVIGSRDKKLYCFEDIPNQAPNIPSKPTGIITGFIDIEYSFQTSTIDQDGDSIYYKWDFGDGTISEWLGPYSSGEVVSASHTWEESGNFNIKVKAKDNKNSESDWSEPYLVEISSQAVNQLIISSLSEVNEGESFEVTVKADGIPIKEVSVIFNDQELLTDANGVVEFTAPDVNEDSEYTIVASKQGYESYSKKIIVDYIEIIGWVYGVIYSNIGTKIDNANICISTIDDESASDCTTYSSDDGLYYIKIAPGNYKLKVNKQGYITQTKTIEIIQNQASELNFILEPLSDSPKKAQKEAIEHLINSEIVNGNIISKLDFDEEAHVQIYNKAIDVEIIEFNLKDKITFQINSNELDEALIAIKINQGSLSNINNLKLTSDGKEIQQVGFSSIIDFKNTLEKAAWTSINAMDENGEEVTYLLIYSPLSKHTISISSIVEIVGGILSIITYFIISIFLVVLFFSPMISKILKRRIFFRKNK